MCSGKLPKNLDFSALFPDIPECRANAVRTLRYGETHLTLYRDRFLTDITTAPADNTTHAVEDLPAEPVLEELAAAAALPPPAWDEEPVSEEEPNGFAELGLSAEIVKAVAAKGYRVPTPIQAQAIPAVFMGRDVLGCAQTGTGKTASFVLPLMDILSGSRARARMPRSLILEPTRELALQVAENFVEYGKFLNLTHALLIGGESLADQKAALMKGVDVLIATPGRLMDLFERGGLLLTDTKILVIDEADRMLDMGFIPDVEKIVGFLPKTRQTLFFSATMAPEIRRLADAFLQNPKEITVSRPASVASTIVAGLAVVDDLDKREALRRLIRGEDVQNALIFCNRKRDVDILYKSLKRHGFSVGSLHGDMSQPERFATLSKFKANEIRLLVCSDVAARGLDIGGLSHVFNFDVPIHAEDYVHRIGRTGRAGLTGHAFTLAAPDDRSFVDAIEKLVGAEIPRIAVEGMDPVAFPEDDGRKRRGRGRGAKPSAKADKPARSRAPRAAVAEALADGGEIPAFKPRRSRARKPEVTAPEVGAPEGTGPALRALEVVEAPVEVQAPEIPAPVISAPVIQTFQEPRRREESRRDEPRRDEARRDEPRRDEPRREEPRFDRSRPRDPRRRDEDLGPSVLGFGEDVPAFMMLRLRSPHPVETVQPSE